MADAPSNKYYCQKCQNTLDEKKFYKSKNIEKYPPDGRLPICKSCLTMHIDNWDPETFKPILEQIDVPYIEEEWNKLMIKYASDPSKITGTTVLGRYLSKMKLKQWKDYCWCDTDTLAEKAKELKEQSLKKQGYTQEEIDEKLAELNTAIPERPETTSEDHVEIISAEEKYFDLELTDDDKKMLILKWGSAYKPYEWVKLEQYYKEMCESYDIQTPAHKDYLTLICKTSLKAHRLVDLNDIEGFQKLSKVYDNLMKSANFTAAQNKTVNGDFIDSISELVAICEKKGFMPTYYDGTDHDAVDATLTDLQRYTHNLINEETNLSTLIESALDKIQNDSKKEEETGLECDTDADLNEIEAEISKIDELENEELDDDDFESHYDFLEYEREKDIQTYKDLTGEDDA